MLFCIPSRSSMEVFKVRVGSMGRNILGEKEESPRRRQRKGKESEVTQSCLTLCDPMGYSLTGSSDHEIFQARVLECITISFSKTTTRYSQIPQDWNASRPLSPSNLLTFHSTCCELIFFFISLSLERSPLSYTTRLKPLGFLEGWMGKEPDCQW